VKLLLTVTACERGLPVKILFAALALLSVCFLTACGPDGHLYPIQGPLSTGSAAPVYTVQYALRAGHINFSAVLANGEFFKGRLTGNTKPETKTRLQDVNNPPATPQTIADLSAAWDTVYGKGYYVAHILGNISVARAALTGSQGSVLQIAVLWGQNTVNGVALDDKGNIYKVVL
jgi:hypothetical protein